MRRLRLRTIASLAASAALALPACAQELATRLRAALALPPDEALQAVGDAAPIAELLDAVATLRADLRDQEWQRIAKLLHRRVADVAAAWERDVEQRTARAAAFAAEPRLGWVVRYRDAAAAERAAILAVARYLDPAEANLADFLRSDEPAHRAAAEALRREAVAGVHARGAEWLLPLRWLAGTQEERAATVNLLDRRSDPPRAQIEPFALASLFDDADRRVRVRAAIRLRQSLSLEVPEWLEAGLIDDPFAAELIAHGRLGQRGFAVGEERIQDLAAAIDAGERPAAAGMIGRHGSPTARRRLAAALVAAIRRTKLPADDAATSDAFCWAHAATALDPRSLVHLLDGAVVAADPHCRQFLVEVVARVAVPWWWSMPLHGGARAAPDLTQRVATRLASDHGRVAAPPSVSVAPDLAQRVAVLLESDDARVREPATRIAARIVDTVPHLRVLFAGHALAVARTGLAGMELTPVGEAVSRPLHELQGGEPSSAEASLVLAVAAAGEPSLAPLLIDACTQVRAAEDRPRRRMHELFVLRCLAGVAPAMAEADADRTWDLVKGDAQNGGARAGEYNLGRAAASIVAGLLATVSDARVPEVLAALDTVLGPGMDAAGRPQVWPDTDAAVRLRATAPVLSPARLRQLLLRRGGRTPELYALYRHAPDLLAAAFGRDRDALGANAPDVLWRIDDWTWAEKQRVAGMLPLGLFVRALNLSYDLSYHQPRAMPLSLLAACRDEDPDRTIATGRPWLVPWLAAQAAVPGELAAWQHLAAAPAAPIAIAAARRLGELGADGRAAAQTALGRLLADPWLHTERAALSAAVDLGLDAPERAAAVARLSDRRNTADIITAQFDADTRCVLLAAALRFDGLPLAQLPRHDAFMALVNAGVDLSPAELAAIAADPSATELQHLLGSRSTVARCTALAAAAGLPAWSEALENAIVAVTADHDPLLRAAAYRALQTRDADLWACAWLVREAEFDFDPAVRALAPPRPR